jgi:hypothetical protein
MNSENNTEPPKPEDDVMPESSDEHGDKPSAPPEDSEQNKDAPAENEPEHSPDPKPAPTVQPPDTSQPAQQQPYAPAKPGADAPLLILQWLTYAFWGWTVLALSVLVGTVMASIVANADTGSFTPYGIAAVLVLLPISFICDNIYSKKEDHKKVGVEIITMVIHSVLFALFTIGSLIYTAFAVVRLLTDGSGTGNTQASLYTALVIAIFYAITFLRTLNPAFTPWVTKYYRYVMLVLILIIAFVAILGPVAKERSLKDDKLLDSGMSGLSTSITSYTGKNNRLPSDLKSLTLTGDSKAIVDKGMVTYKPEGATVNAASISANKTSYSYNPAVFKYQLCATFKKASKANSNNYNSYDYVVDDTDGYTTYLSTAGHTVGQNCYKVKTGY